MTKKELLEAIKDMPEDAEVYIDDTYGYWYPATDIDYSEGYNTIYLC